MSSDGVGASTSGVNSSSDLLDQIVQSVLDSEDFRLPEYYPEELLRLATTEDTFDRDAKTKNDSVPVDGDAGTNRGSHSIRDQSSYRNCEDDENLCRCCSASGRICQIVTSDDCRKNEIVASVSTSRKDSFTFALLVRRAMNFIALLLKKGAGLRI